MNRSLNTWIAAGALLVTSFAHAQVTATKVATVPHLKSSLAMASLKTLDTSATSQLSAKNLNQMDIKALSTSSELDGGADAGGGNSIDDHMIEDYLVLKPYDKKLPHFDATMSTLVARVRQALPQLANQIQAAIDQQNWHVIPRRMRLLPTSVTGLRFLTDQAAYQNGHEIFIDETSLAEMVKKGTEANLYKHEILMATLGLNATQTRQLLEFMIKNPDYDADFLRREINFLFQREIAYLTPTEIAFVQKLYGQLVQDMTRICDQEAGPKRIDAIKAYLITYNTLPASLGSAIDDFAASEANEPGYIITEIQNIMENNTSNMLSDQWSKKAKGSDVTFCKDFGH